MGPGTGGAKIERKLTSPACRGSPGIETPFPGLGTRDHEHSIHGCNVRPGMRAQLRVGVLFVVQPSGCLGARCYERGAWCVARNSGSDSASFQSGSSAARTPHPGGLRTPRLLAERLGLRSSSTAFLPQRDAGWECRALAAG